LVHPRHPAQLSPQPRAVFPGTSGSATTAEESAALIAYFHARFYGAKGQQRPSPRETRQARRLIEDIGFERAKHLVEFAKAAAEKTKYSPASFNGILQYEGRALADWEARAGTAARAAEQRRRAQRSQIALSAQQREIVGQLVTRVGRVKTSAPAAFTAFLGHVEAEKNALLSTPVARGARPETREMVSREYARPEKRLEIFTQFFAPTGKGAPLLGDEPGTHEVSQWLGAMGAAARKAIEMPDFSVPDASLFDLHGGE
jgi:hypothetical protein